MADEPNELERLVARRIREQLREEGGLERLLEGRQQIEAQLKGSGGIAAQIQPAQARLEGVVVSPGPALLVLRGAAPELAIDIEGRSPRDIKLAIELWVAFITTLGVLWQIYSTFHQQPPTSTQINEIFNQTTTIVHQTINMPPPPTTP